MAGLSWKGAHGVEKRELTGETRIGRSPQNDIQILDPSVSTFHGRVTQETGGWVFVDDNSTNGSSVNGKKVQRCPLKDGDELCLGYFPLRFAGDPPARPSAEGFRVTSRHATPLTIASTLFDSANQISKMISDVPNVTTLGAVKAKDVDNDRASSVQTTEALARRLKASSEIAKATAAAVALSEVLERVLDALFAIFGAAERSLILLVDPTSREIETAGAKHRSGGDTRDIAISQTALNQAMEQHEALLCGDAMADSQLGMAQSIVDMGIRSMMIAPLLFKDEVLGAIYVDTRSGVGKFDQPDLELLSVAAGQVAARVANAQLHEKMVVNERLAAVGQTVAGLTHCIKNILQGIQGGAYIVDMAIEGDDRDTLGRGWEMVKRNNKFMEELVFDLLSYSKQREPAYEAVDLNAVCEEACELPRARGDTKGVPVSFVGDPEIGQVEIDPKGIKRCLLNLAMNAVDACAGKGGELTVETKKPGEDGMARILVRDTGPGMPDAVKAKLFTVFFSTKGSKGTGLGLPVSRKIVEEHGGTLEVESEVGVGTTFTISLPATRKTRPTDVD